MVLFVCACGAVVAAAPKPEKYLKELKYLFPTAAAFSPPPARPATPRPKGAIPRTHPEATLLGYAFWTTDLVPNEHGYHGPIHILVGMDTRAFLTGIVVDWDSEPYGYFSVEPDKFAAQFKGKNIRDPFRVGFDVDAVSRASLSIGSATRAIRDSSRLVARELLPADQSR